MATDNREPLSIRSASRRMKLLRRRIVWRRLGVPILLARISHTFRVNRQRTLTDTRRAPIPAVGGIYIPSGAGIKRNAVAVEVRKDSPEGYEKSGLGISSPTSSSSLSRFRPTPYSGFPCYPNRTRQARSSSNRPVRWARSRRPDTPNSPLQINSIHLNEANEVVLNWAAVPGAIYAIDGSGHELAADVESPSTTATWTEPAGHGIESAANTHSAVRNGNRMLAFIGLKESALEWKSGGFQGRTFPGWWLSAAGHRRCHYRNVTQIHKLNVCMHIEFQSGCGSLARMPTDILAKTFQIAALPGDGIGVDVMAEALRVLAAVEGGMDGFQFEVTGVSLWGGGVPAIWGCAAGGDLRGLPGLLTRPCSARWACRRCATLMARS